MRSMHKTWWFWTGSVLYAFFAISSIVQSIEPMSAFESVAMVLDWLAACVLYFFLGGLLGWFIDRWHHKLAFPPELWAALGFWALSSTLMALLDHGRNVSWPIVAFFPWAYGIFFTGIAFVRLMPKSLEPSLIAKTLFDVFFLAAFAGWMWAALEEKRLVRWILAGVVFAVLTLGLAGCASMV